MLQVYNFRINILLTLLSGAKTETLVNLNSFHEDGNSFPQISESISFSPIIVSGKSTLLDSSGNYSFMEKIFPLPILSRNFKISDSSGLDLDHIFFSSYNR